MKYSNLKTFEKHLESASPSHFSRIYMILMKEAFERKVALDSLVGYLLKGERNPELLVKVFEGDRIALEDFWEELNALTFFSQRRVIVIQQADKLNKVFSEKLETYFLNPNPSLYLVLLAPALNHATTFYKNTEKAGIIFEVSEEKPWEKEKTIKEWVAAKVQGEGKRIDYQTVNFLVKQIGTEQALLHQEIEKLFCYIGDRHEITRDDVGAICVTTNGENSWQLGEAIFRRDPLSAIRISKAVLSEGTPFLSLLRMIRTQMQTEYQVCSILSTGGTRQDVEQQFPFMRGQILETHLQNAQGYGLKRFKQALLKIDETEMISKSSGRDLDFLAEILIIKLTA